MTPEDYEPPGFRFSDSDEFQFKEEPMNIRVGDVNTVCTIVDIVSLLYNMCGYALLVFNDIDNPTSLLK